MFIPVFNRAGDKNIPAEWLSAEQFQKAYTHGMTMDINILVIITLVKKTDKWHSTPEQRTPKYQSYKLW